MIPAKPTMAMEGITEAALTHSPQAPANAEKMAALRIAGTDMGSTEASP